MKRSATALTALLLLSALLCLLPLTGCARQSPQDTSPLRFTQAENNPLLLSTDRNTVSGIGHSCAESPSPCSGMPPTA